MMKKTAVVVGKISVLLILFLSGCAPEEVDSIEKVESINVTEVETHLMASVNDHRQSMGLATLHFSSVAYAAANDHNDYMISKGDLSHDNFDLRASRIYAEADAKEVAENVGKNFRTAEEALQWWLNSPNHKSSLEGDFTHTGISVKKDSDNNLYYTQIFFK